MLRVQVMWIKRDSKDSPWDGHLGWTRNGDKDVDFVLTKLGISRWPD